MEIELDPLAGPDGGKESHRLAAFWNDQIEKLGKDKGFTQYIKRGHKIEDRYRDERNKTDAETRRRYNSLWANVETLLPAIYGRTPQPLAERKFGDKDPIARGAAQILERALRNEVEICGFNDAMTQAVRDYLLPGRGTLWVRYEPQITRGISLGPEDGLDMKDNEGELEPDLDDEIEEGQDQPEDKLEETGDQVIRESTPVDYLHWEDFLSFPENARTWAEVVAVGKRVYLTFEEMRNRFGKEIAKNIPLQKDERQKDRHQNSNIQHELKGEIFEIWNKVDRTVYWVAEGYEYLLDRKDDPLNLEGFFPTPRPIIANQTNGTILPVADYIQYQDQATQIDELSQRIAMLTRACKVAGVYNAAAKGIQRLFNESVENELIPVDDWSAFAEKGGVEGSISFLPLKEIIGVINELMSLKEKQVEEMNNLTGISDLMRGTSDARETLGGQRLKSNYTGTRLTARQNEVARFARDTVRIMADIMAQHFSPQSLVEVSGAMFEEGLGVDVAGVEAAMAAAAPPPPQAPPMPGQAGPPAPPMGGPPQVGPGMPAPPMGGPLHPMPMPGAPGALPQGMPGQGAPNVVPFPPRPAAPPPVPTNPQPSMPMQPPAMQAPPVAPGLPAPPPPDPMQIATQQALQRIDAAISLLRNERLRGFRVDIEVDSTIFGDAAQEKGDRTEFIETTTKYLQTALAMSAQVPEITPLLGKLLQFGVRGFRVGRDLESAIEEFCDDAVKISKQKQQEAASKPNPEQIKANAQAQQAQATTQAAQARSQADIAKSKSDIQGAQIESQSNQQQAQAEVAKQQMESQSDQAADAANLQIKQMEVRMREMEVQMEAMRMHTELNKPPPPPPTNPAAMKGGV
jgi:hypothetical protein